MLKTLRPTARFKQLIGDAKLFLGIYKYHLAEQHDGIELKPGKIGVLGGFIAVEGHHKIFGSKEHGYEDVGICLYDFRRDVREPKNVEKLPKFLHDFQLGGASTDISDLCHMNKHCAEGEELDRELTQLVMLARKYDTKIRKIWYCGDRCAANYPSLS